MIREIRLPALLLASSLCTFGAEAGHYLPGFWSIRDWAVPDKGWYFSQYGFGYHSTELRDAGGASVSRLSSSVNTVTFAPTFLWSSGRRTTGADFSLMISPSFGKTGVANRLYTLNTQHDPGRERWGAGDMFVQPFRAAWGGDTFSLIAAYGFYAPVGSYSPGAADNVGLGLWSHQFSGSFYWYPQHDPATALMFTTVYESNGQRSGTTNSPGGHLGLEYGATHYFGKRVEFGFAGFDYYQVSDDRGAAAVSPTVHEQVHGAGPEGTLWIVTRRLSLTFRAMWEYNAHARYQGTAANATLTYAFRKPK